MKVGVVGIAILMMTVCWSMRERAQYKAEKKEIEICAKVETFIRIVERGVPLSPSPNPEETELVENTNNYIRGMLAAALLGSPCG